MLLLKNLLANKVCLLARNVVFGAEKGVVSACQSRLAHDLKIDVQDIKDIKDAQKDDMPINLEANPYKRPKKVCILCKYGIEPDYKNVRLLSQFQSRFTGRLYARNITGLCKEKQKKLYHEVCKAQNAGLMGYYTKNPAFARDPKLFDPNNPFRPHAY